MQFRFLASVAVFLGSYLPLALILFVQDVNYAVLGNGFCSNFRQNGGSCIIPLLHPKFSLVILFVCVASFCASLAVLSFCRPRVPIDITEAKYIPAELMSYTLPYVVSFMSIGYQETGKFLGLSIFLAWMFWITHKSGQLILNPILTVFGWRLYEIKYAFPGDSTARMGRVLAYGQIEPGQRYLQTMVQDILIIRPNNQTEKV
jgi:hypothetical protein